MKAAVFLDRDGVINKNADPHCYITRIEDIEILPNVKEAIDLLKDNDYLVLVVSNQRGIARGIMSMDDVNDINQYLVSQCDLKIDKFYICPHEKGTCNCRKPDIGLFLQAEEDYNIDKSKSWMIGDTDTDIEAGNRYGIKTIKTTSLYDAVRQIIPMPK